jgi:esterase/lipase
MQTPKNNNMNKPTIEEIVAYLVDEKKYTAQAAQSFADKFWNYYESVGWTVGAKKKMVSWKAAIRTWELKNNSNAHQQSSNRSQRLGVSAARIEVARNW